MTTASKVQFKTLPTVGGNPRDVSEVVRGLMEGKSNNAGYFSTTAGVTTTTLYDPRIGFDSAILFMPLEANAAAELATLYVSARAQGNATVTHGNRAYSSDFMYIIVG
jgi:hypothetical protein